jgi:hypothetical protein
MRPKDLQAKWWNGRPQQQQGRQEGRFVRRSVHWYGNRGSVLLFMVVFGDWWSQKKAAAPILVSTLWYRSHHPPIRRGTISSLFSDSDFIG